MCKLLIMPQLTSQGLSITQPLWLFFMKKIRAVFSHFVTLKNQGLNCYTHKSKPQEGSML